MELQERTVRRVKEGTVAALVKSGMSEELWNQATECCCHLRNICDTVADGKTAYQKLFNALSKATVIPFGANVVCTPINPKDESRLDEFGTKMFLGVFVGYSINAGRGWIGDLFGGGLERL